MRLVGFCHGGPFDPHSWSGSNRGIFSALKKMDLITDVFDVDVRDWRRYWSALREYSPNRKVWSQNFLKSPYQFTARTKNVERYLSQISPKPEAVLQIGAMFDAVEKQKGMPRFCYLDSNSALSEKGGIQSFSFYAKKEYKHISFIRERNIYHNSAAIFVFSDYVKKSLIKDFSVNENNIHTVYAGVNLTIPFVQEEIKKDPIILFIGRDFERKGGELLLRAFSYVRRQITNAKLIIAGSSPSIDAPGVEIVGFIDKNSPDGERKLGELFSQASVFTMPSHFEPFGIVYAEAMHFGLPCVGVRRCAMPEIISDRITGFLVPPDNEVELSQALVTILKNPLLAQSMGAEAKIKAKKLFTWEETAKKMATVINKSREDTCLDVAI